MTASTTVLLAAESHPRGQQPTFRSLPDDYDPAAVVDVADLRPEDLLH